MATVRQVFGQYNLGDGIELDVFMTYDTVTLKVASFDWTNPGPATTLTITINGTPFSRTIQTGPDSFVPGGAGITLLPPQKAGQSPVFPFTVSVAPG